MEYEDTMQEIYKVMVEQNKNAFSGVKKIAEYIKKQYNYKLTIDEQLYLLIHIKRILDVKQDLTIDEITPRIILSIVRSLLYKEK